MADVFDALCQSRVYKKAWKTDEAYGYILSEAGESFDPRIVAAFKKIYPSVRKLYAHISVNQPDDSADAAQSFHPTDSTATDEMFKHMIENDKN